MYQQKRDGFLTTVKMSSMLRKKEVFTIVTPIPHFIPRQLAIDILHSHSEVITLNPLVLDHKPIKAPRNAAEDEYYSTWYEINQRIQYVPGIGKMGSGKISFNGCFHDMPWGLQTHIYAPMNVDLKNRYRIAGNQSGFEPPEQQEIGLAQLGAPRDGLYLRDDVEIKCNVAMAAFVKAQLKSASGEMVKRIIRKAELLDRGVLQGMIENGKLRTHNPNDRTSTMSPEGGIVSPRLQHSPTFNDVGKDRSYTPDQPMPYQVPRPMSYQQQQQQQQSQQHYNNRSRPGVPSPNSHWSAPAGMVPQPLAVKPPPGPARTHAELPEQQSIDSTPVEMPGDYAFPAAPQPQQQPQQQQFHQQFGPPQRSPTWLSDRDSGISGHSSSSRAPSLQPGGGGIGGGDWRWSQSQHGSNSQHNSLYGTNPSRPTSVQSDGSGGAGGGMHSPGLPTDHLPTHEEMPEHEQANVNADALRKLDPVAARRAQYVTSTPPPAPPQYAYNPADYSKGGGRSQSIGSRNHSYGY